MKYLAFLLLVTSVAVVGCKKNEADTEAPAVTSTPAPKPMTTDAYGTKLSDLIKGPQAAITKLAADKDAATWITDADAAIKAMGDMEDELKKLTPPVGLEKINSLLIKQTEDFKGVLTKGEADVKGGNNAAMDLSGPLATAEKDTDAEIDKAITDGGWDLKAFHGTPTVFKKADAAAAPGGAATGSETPAGGAAPTGTTTGG